MIPRELIVLQDACIERGLAGWTEEDWAVAEDDARRADEGETWEEFLIRKAAEPQK